MTNRIGTISRARFGWPLLAALLLLLFAVQARAQDFPALSGRVVDQADLLSPAQEQAIAAKSEALETASGRQFVVATVASLQGYEIRDYGYRLARSWGIGTARNDGVVLLVAPNERQVAIEVGYGLEPILTDALSIFIIREQILPWFKQGDMPGGIISGADAILAQLSLPAEEAEAYQRETLAAEAARDESSGDGSFFAFIFWLFVILFIFFVVAAAGSGGGSTRARRYRRGRGPVVIWGSDWSSGGSSWGSGSSWGGSSGGSSWGGGSSGGFSGGGGSFGGGGASGSW